MIAAAFPLHKSITCVQRERERERESEKEKEREKITYVFLTARYHNKQVRRDRQTCKERDYAVRPKICKIVKKT